MHSSGSITSMRPNSWMQSTGKTSTQERSLMSMQGSAMMYVIPDLVHWGPASNSPRSERLLDLVQALDEAVDLLGDRVEVEARPVRGGDAEPGHQRLTAVVPGADRDALPVEDLGDVVRMDALDVERDDPGAPLRRRPKDVHPRHVRQA